MLARLPTVALFLALCFAVCFFVAHHTGSRAWGLGAFALTGFCPNLMAHGRLATVDVALSLFCFLAVALFVAMLERPAYIRGAGVGAASAAAALSKTSGNILGLVFLLLLAVVRPKERKFYLCLLMAVIAAVAVLEVVILAEGGEAYVAANFPDLPRVAVPFAEYLANLAAIRDWYRWGHDKPQFLLGEFSTRGWWHYYPVAIALKTTIPALLLVAGSWLVAFVSWRRRSGPAESQEPGGGSRNAVLACLLFAALFLLIAARGQLALGIRYVLPIYPFLYAAAMILWSAARVARRHVVWMVTVLLVWHAGENLAAYPSYIGYFNEFIGSHRNADRFLIDSNLDWGQDLRRLDVWCLENGVTEIALHYFGGADPEFDLTARVIGGYGPGAALLPKGFFALSRHFYRVSFSPQVSRVTYDDYLAASKARYVTTVGDSIMVYRIE
ncbi:MAG TPA: hypothetical protein VMS98_19890 [Thermoanaerobaculia bacterium]|nr:hypothetical protein [Thermoanaerobaculia bacterium]